MLKNVVRRCLTRNELRKGQLRYLITQPTILDQGEDRPPIFLNPPSPSDKKFSKALRENAIKSGVDVENIDLRMFQVKQENLEFDPPALPPEDSKAWGFLWGDELVKKQLLLDTLSEEDEYLRGYLEKTTTELKRKMLIHYPNVDWESTVEKMLAQYKSQPSTFDRMYQQSKIEALSNLMKNDKEGYVNLYRNNSYIKSYDAGDKFGYNIPADLLKKLENYMQFSWDQTAANPNLESYMKMLGQFSEFLEPKLKTLDANLNKNIIDFIKEETKNDTTSVGCLVDALNSTSKLLTGDLPNNVPKKVEALLKVLKADGAPKPKDAENLVRCFRGQNNSSEAANIKGKSDAELITQFSDVSEDRLDALCYAMNACGALSNANTAQVVMSYLFNNFPCFFSQFATTPENVDNFISQNGAAFEEIIGAVNSQRKASNDLSKGIEKVVSALDSWFQSNLSLDKPSLNATLEDLPSLLHQSGESVTPWYVTYANNRAANASTALEKVEAETLSSLFTNLQTVSTIGSKLYEKFLNPGGNLRSVASAAEKGSLGDSLAENVRVYLENSGRTTPTQSALISKISGLQEIRDLGATAKTANAAYQATDAAFSKVNWVLEDTTSLEMAGKSLPHISFDNVNAY